MTLSDRVFRGRSVQRSLTYVILAFTCLVVLYPLLVIISSSFKTESEIFTYPMTIIPRLPVLRNFAALRGRFPLYIINSVKVTLLITAVQVVTATTAGYAFSKLRWKGRNFLFLLYISSIMIPFQVYIIPQFIIIRLLGLYDTHLALILVSSFTAFGTFLVRQFFMTIPDSYIEAAKMSGVNHFHIFMKIMLPLSKPVIATLGILSFRYWWNDLFTPLIYLTSQALKTLPLGLADFVSEYDVYYGPQMAASLIAIIPVLAIYIFAQKYIVSGVVASGIKG
jgi:multiple sugar transport system permease protein